MLVNEFKKIAKERQLTEVWLGTETDNDAANGLYARMDPYEIEQAVIYSYKVQ